MIYYQFIFKQLGLSIYNLSFHLDKCNLFLGYFSVHLQLRYTILTFSAKVPEINVREREALSI